MGYKHEIKRFGEWFGQQDFTHKVFVPGNHDFLFQDNEAEGRGNLRKGCPDVHYLRSSHVELEVRGQKIKIWGSPYTPFFCNWAFNIHTYTDGLKNEWAKIPKGTDIIVTHGPPYGINDTCTHGERVGCRELKKACERTRPLVHIGGHIHEGWGWQEWKDILFVNPAICNAVYNPIQKPIVIIVDNGKVVDCYAYEGKEEDDDSEEVPGASAVQGEAASETGQKAEREVHLRRDVEDSEQQTKIEGDADKGREGQE